MLQPGPTKEELDLIGITLADLGEAAQVEVWSCNWDAYELFKAMDTQWRYGMSGPTGMDYTALIPTMEMLGIEASARRNLFLQLRIMEDEARHQIAKARSG